MIPIDNIGLSTPKYANSNIDSSIASHVELILHTIAKTNVYNLI